MLAALGPRGPDDHGIFTTAEASIGMTRLAILDPGPDGHQPMIGADGKVALVMNGEIYNFRALKATLESSGHRFRSQGDAEVALALYLQDGEKFVEHLSGMFAIAILDVRGGPGREQLLLARDNLGQKPLLYACLPGGGLVFASEIKALLASGAVRRELDHAALRQLLTFGAVRQPRTMLAGVKMLMPGHIMVAGSGRLAERRFWHLAADRAGGLRWAGTAEGCAEMGRTLRRSVREHLVSDVGVCAFLSGGIDSALVCALAAEENPAIETFSLGFPGQPHGLDETEDAALLAGAIGVPHTRIEVDGSTLRDCLNQFVTALDQPSVDGVNTYLLSRAVHNHGFKVALSGTGGDELFGGYPWFASVLEGSSRFDRWPWPGWRGRFLARFGQSRFTVFTPEEVAGLLGGPVRKLSEDLASDDPAPEMGAFDRLTALTLGSYTRDQLLRDIDCLSMANGVEVRVPFLSPPVVDTALSLPGMARIGAGDPFAPPGSYAAMGLKRTLFQIAGDRLPPWLALKPKRGFNIPLDAWLRGPLRELAGDILSRERACRRGFLCPDGVVSVRDAFLCGKTFWPQTWLLLVLDLWISEILGA
jgi:asparagine synthase (glutamine-hydrolysing)